MESQKLSSFARTLFASFDCYFTTATQLHYFAVCSNIVVELSLASFSYYLSRKCIHFAFPNRFLILFVFILTRLQSRSPLVFFNYFILALAESNPIK